MRFGFAALLMLAVLCVFIERRTDVSARVEKSGHHQEKTQEAPDPTDWNEYNV